MTLTHLGEPKGDVKPKDDNFSDFFDSMRSKFSETISKMGGPSEQSKKSDKSIKSKPTKTVGQKQTGTSKTSKIIIVILIGGVLYLVALIFTFFLGMLSPY